MRWRCVWLSFFALSVDIVTNVQARLVRNHVSSICSTWGRNHFKTFDGDMYEFPTMCEYNLVSDCHDSFQEFSVHMRRKETDGNPTVSYVVVTISDLSFHISKSVVTVNAQLVEMPYYNAGVQVEKNAVYIKLQSKVGITVMWNGDDAVMVELDHDYANRTCGLCGDFNGVLLHNEFIHHGRKISPFEFGNRHRVHRPNDDCENPSEEEDESLAAEQLSDSCTQFQPFCMQMLSSGSWSSCTSLIDPEPYIQACVQDMCGCNVTNDFCVCSTLSEFSRLCSHAGGQPPNWRTPHFCDKQCPFNMVYQESGSPCMDTCSYRDTSSLCEDHKMDGCFCPPGTVFDDISERGCISQSECQCKDDKIYNSGEVNRQGQTECTCVMGSWSCKKQLEMPATCAVEEGSHVTTFDGKTFTFHGECHYTLAKVQSKDDKSPKFTILVQLIPCVNQEYDTCLKTLKLLLNNDKHNVLTFTSDGKVKQNSQIMSLPYQVQGVLYIFRASSFHILLQTSFGLQIQIQHVPMMQVYVSLEHSYRAKTQGLCGNYNMVLADDMKTPQGIVEGTAVTFSNSWKANHMCQDRTERLDDPCSLSVENEKYAQHWCALLLKTNATFAQCHSVVDPELYHKRCTYASCNCEKSEACLCAVLSSYARACASKGVFLTDWRDNVCDKYMRNCPMSQTFSYKHQRCQLTCKSLSSKQQSCITDFLPVDGCSCSEGLYLNENDICVPMAKCPCYYNEVQIKPGKSINIKDEHCVCSNGVLRCNSWRASSVCPFPKVFINCSTPGIAERGVQCARTCLNLDNDDCDSTECESGCYCPSGLIDDGKGFCVKESQCPCQHNGRLYAPGTQIPNQCNTCTCRSGRWECTEKRCPGTCVIYGSGHYKTFDQRMYAFNGQCEYVAVKNKCGNKTVQENFGVITENAPCGTTGTTCSKIVRVLLGRMEIKLSKGKHEEQDLGHGPQIQYRISKFGLYLVIESAIGLTVMWDRKTTVRILLEPQHSGEVCGLCGDFDGDGHDFITQNQMVVSSPVKFANSWKVSSGCRDMRMNVNPCEAEPKRHLWAKMTCSIITGETFKECHNKVEPHPFYDNCVTDACACDTGGDCECFCTAVAAYAQACNDAGVCVSWRTPKICPVFCDYYNGPQECKWHYNPCHTTCYKTCLNPQGNCSATLPLVEGCYPVCPEDRPIFDEDKEICVEECSGCFYNGTRYKENEVVYNVTDNLGMCYYAICINTTVIHENKTCTSSTVQPPTLTTILTTELLTTQTVPLITTEVTTTLFSTPQTQPSTTVSTKATTTLTTFETEITESPVPSTSPRTESVVTATTPLQTLTSTLQPTTTKESTTFPTTPFTKTAQPTSTTTPYTKYPTSTQEPTTTTESTSIPTTPATATTTAKSTTPHSEPSTSTLQPTTTMKSTSIATTPATATTQPTTIATTTLTTFETEITESPVPSTSPRTESVVTATTPLQTLTSTLQPTTTTESTSIPTTPATATTQPTTTATSTTPHSEPPTSTLQPTTRTESTSIPTTPAVTGTMPTSTTKSSTPFTEFPTSTQGPTTTTVSTSIPTTPATATTQPTNDNTSQYNANFNTKSTTPHRVSDFNSAANNHNRIYIHSNHTCDSNYTANYNSNIYNTSQANIHNGIYIHSNYTCCNRNNANFNYKIYNPLHRVSDFNSGANNHNSIYIHSNYTCYSNYTANCNSNINNTSQNNANFNHKIYNPIHRVSDFNSGANNHNSIYIHSNHTCYSNYTANYNSNINNTSQANIHNGIYIHSNYTCCNRNNANFNYKIYNPLHRISNFNSGANNHNSIYIHSNYTCDSNYTANYNSNIHNTSQ
ncbi:mucin-2-like isoform X1 [Solea senegalensis]|uniref:Mucin-2-like isoform X1 n=1 Tax=Solea senegalensis TaxID=28829 RepID=A0AAV6PMD7_SOLSE|nr:mucin-2-like isoform X1 [Solea senegalensis]